MSKVSVQDAGATRLVTITNPPVNALSVGDGIVAELRAAIEDARGSEAVAAIVLRSGLRIFSGGADIADFDRDPASPDQLRGLFDMIEASPKPVIAAIAGKALGGGLELVLACHYRIADDEARFALPEITLGLLPGGGGTQRLPRLVGLAAARAMILSGRTIGCAEALTRGLVDARVDAGDLDAVLTFAREVAGKPVTPTRARAVILDEAPADEALPRLGSADARAAIGRCLDAARTLDAEEGLRVEAAEFDALAAGAPARGLRHVFFGRRAVATIPDLPEGVATRPIARVGIVGAGLMGRGITIACLDADLSVGLVDSAEAARASAGEAIAKTIQRDVEKGRSTRAAADARLARLGIHADLAALADADLIIEAVFEDLAVKRAIFAALERHAKPTAILASNTSTLDIDAIGSALSDPSRCIGLHFFSPANVMKLVEIVRGERTGSVELATAMGFAKAIGKVGVVARSCDGFIGNRMFEEYLRQAYALLEEGALPSQVDRALEAWGMAMGPLKVMDLAGQDIGWAIRKRRMIEQPDRPYSRIPDLVCEMGRFGQKTGAGFYLYPDGRTAAPDPEIDALVERYSRENGIPRRTIDDAEIVDRCVLALAQEGARILDEGIAYRPVDIDMVYVFGYGFPAERGGPMFLARERGLDWVGERIAAFSRGRGGWAWSPDQWRDHVARSSRKS